MPAGDPVLPGMQAEIDATNLRALTQLVQDCKDCKKPPWPADTRAEAAQSMLDYCLSTPRGTEERRAAVKEHIKRFIHGGQIVSLRNIPGKLSYRNERVGLILHNEQDEQGRYTVRLHDFAPPHFEKVEESWIRVPANCVKVQIGMVEPLMFNFQFEKAMKKAGVGPWVNPGPGSGPFKEEDYLTPWHRSFDKSKQKVW